MNPLRVAVCDDEPLALKRHVSLLQQCADVEVVGTFRNGEDLLNEVLSCRPHALLLDVQMPRLDGLDVAAALQRMSWPDHEPPILILVTAHPRFAVDAFESEVLDFINKPIRLSRLERALERARTACEQRRAGQKVRDLETRICELERRPASSSGSIWVKSNGATLRVSSSAIKWARSEGEYVRVHCLSESYLERMSLSALAERLEQDGFIRIHRSALVRADDIERIETREWGRPFVRLKCGAQLPVGRKYRSALQSVTSRIRSPRRNESTSQAGAEGG